MIFGFASGRLHRSENIVLLSFSPLWTGIWLLLFLFICSRCRGDTSESQFFNSRSPSCEPEKLWFWKGCIFVHFRVFHLSGPAGEVYNYIGVVPPYTMYIYSLRHFLTTKGALIDGDGYPLKNPKNGSKKGDKLIKIWLKLMSKNTKKQWFLMANRTFSSKSPKLDKKSLKIDQNLTHI